MGCVLSFDVGTSTLKAALINDAGHIEATASATYPVSRPREGFAEQSPQDWWNAVVKTTREVMSKTTVPAEEVLGIVFATQAIGIIPLSKQDQKPLCPAIIWLDARAGDEAEEFFQATGVDFTGKDVAPKLLWLNKNRPDIWEQMDCFLDVNGYLVYRCTGEKIYDYASASAVAYDHEKGEMSAELLGAVGFDAARFPRLVRSEECIGTLTLEAADELKLTTNTKVFGGTNDMQATALGSGMCCDGEGHFYLGSSGWAAGTSNIFMPLSNGGASVSAAEFGKALRFYQPETACTAYNWCIDQMFPIEKQVMGEPAIYKHLNDLVGAVPPGSDYLLFGPWMEGERCPISDIYARGSFINLGLSHTRAHMLRAVMEGIAYNLRWANEAMEKDFGHPTPTVRILGGGTQSKVWMQIFADIFNRPVEVLRNTQAAGAVGAAFIAAMGLGLYDKYEDVKLWAKVEAEYFPIEQNVAVYEEMYQHFKESYHCVADLYQRINYKRVRGEE